MSSNQNSVTVVPCRSGAGINGVSSTEFNDSPLKNSDPIYGMVYSEAFYKGPDRKWVLLIHGAGGSVRTWKYQLEILKANFNVLQMDLRDHGNSQTMPSLDAKAYSFQLLAEDVLRLMEARGIQKAHFVGVSMGTIVVRWIERLAPEKVRSITFAGGVFSLKRPLNFGLKLALPIARLVPFSTLSRFLSFLLLPRRNHQKARGIFLREADRIHPLAYRKWLRMLRNIRRELEGLYRSRISVPTLVVMGAQDHAFLRSATAFSNLHTNVELNVIEKCGHVCNIEAATDFNKSMLDFLRKQG